MLANDQETPTQALKSDIVLAQGLRVVWIEVYVDLPYRILATTDTPGVLTRRSNKG